MPLHVTNALIQVAQHRKEVTQSTTSRIKCESKASDPSRTAIFVIAQGPFRTLHPGIHIDHGAFQHCTGFHDAFGEVFDFQPRSECVNEPNFLFAAGKKFSAEPKSLVKKQSILHLLPTKNHLNGGNVVVRGHFRKLARLFRVTLQQFSRVSTCSEKCNVQFCVFGKDFLDGFRSVFAQTRVIICKNHQIGPG